MCLLEELVIILIGQRDLLKGLFDYLTLLDYRKKESKDEWNELATKNIEIVYRIP